MAGRIGQFAKRLTGLSVWGASWTPTAAHRDVARDLIVFLEDRRVFYTPAYAETPSYCVRSIIETRHYLTSALQSLGDRGPLAESIRAIRIACRHFLDRLHLDGEGDHDAMGSHGHWQSWEFQDALGQLRGTVGIHIALIADRFGLPVREGLRAILPAEATKEDLNG